MPQIIYTGESERMPLTFEYIDADGNKKDLTDYTVTPRIYELGTNTIYKTGDNAGTITWVDRSNGKFSFLPAESIFVSGVYYNLRFLFVANNETYEKLDYDIEYRIR